MGFKLGIIMASRRRLKNLWNRVKSLRENEVQLDDIHTGNFFGEGTFTIRGKYTDNSRPTPPGPEPTPDRRPEKPGITQGVQLREIGAFPNPPEIFVIHDSEGYNLYSCEVALTRNGAPLNKQVSCHFGIERGPAEDDVKPEIREWVPIDRRAVHAEGLGANWLGRTDMNSMSLGVEMINYGVGSTDFSTLPQSPYWDPRQGGNKEYGPQEDHRTLGRWESTATTYTYTTLDKWRDDDLAQSAYTMDQLSQLVDLTLWLVDTYKIVPECIVGHEHLTAQKPDPGPAFPWSLFFKTLETRLKNYKELDLFWHDFTQKTGYRIKSLQSHLKRLDLYHLYVDGIWGAGTVSGLEQGWDEWGEAKGWSKEIYDEAVRQYDTLTLCKFYVQVGGKYR